MTIANAKPDLLITGPIGTSMVNAASSAWHDYLTVEAKITAAIAYAVSIGAKYCYVPDSFLPYTASLVTFNPAVKMLREGSNPAWLDVQAYGAAGNGVQDDTIACQAALTAATSGQTVFAPAGTYLLGVAGLLFGSAKGTTLLGAGRDATTFLRNTVTTGDGIVFGATYQRVQSFRVEGPNSAVSGSLIHGSSGTDHCEALDIHTFRGFHGITFDTGTGALIDGCVAENFNGNGLYFSGAEVGGIIIASEALNTGTNGQNGIFVAPNSTHCTVDSCYVAGCGGIQNAGYAGIRLEDTLYCRVTGCISVSNNNQAILLTSATACKYNVVNGNLCVGSLGGSGEGITIFQANTANNVIQNNIVLNCATNGIEVFDAGKYNLVQGNYVEGAGVGSGTGSGTGIFVANTTGTPFTSILGNTCRRNNFSGIQIHNSANCIVNDNMCVDNNQGASGSVTQQNGITFSGTSTGCVCTSNKCRNDAGTTQGYGIRLENTADANLAFNDTFGNNTGAILDSVGNSQKSGNRRSTGKSQGQAVLVGGTVTVSTAEILAGDNALLTRVVQGGTAHGDLEVGTIVAGTSFVINAKTVLNALETNDTSTIFWQIVH